MSSSSREKTNENDADDDDLRMGEDDENDDEDDDDDQQTSFRLQDIDPKGTLKQYIILLNRRITRKRPLALLPPNVQPSVPPTTSKEKKRFGAGYLSSSSSDSSDNEDHQVTHETTTTGHQVHQDLQGRSRLSLELGSAEPSLGVTDNIILPPPTFITQPFININNNNNNNNNIQGTVQPIQLPSPPPPQAVQGTAQLSLLKAELGQERAMHFSTDPAIGRIGQSLQGRDPPGTLSVALGQAIVPIPPIPSIQSPASEPTPVIVSANVEKEQVVTKTEKETSSAPIMTKKECIDSLSDEEKLLGTYETNRERRLVKWDRTLENTVENVRQHQKIDIDRAERWKWSIDDVNQLKSKHRQQYKIMVQTIVKVPELLNQIKQNKSELQLLRSLCDIANEKSILASLPPIMEDEQVIIKDEQQEKIKSKQEEEEEKKINMGAHPSSSKKKEDEKGEKKMTPAENTQVQEISSLGISECINFNINKNNMSVSENNLHQLKKNDDVTQAARPSSSEKNGSSQQQLIKAVQGTAQLGALSVALGPPPVVAAAPSSAAPPSAPILAGVTTQEREMPPKVNKKLKKNRLQLLSEARRFPSVQHDLKPKHKLLKPQKHHQFIRHQERPMHFSTEPIGPAITQPQDDVDDSVSTSAESIGQESSDGFLDGDENNNSEESQTTDASGMTDDGEFDDDGGGGQEFHSFATVDNDNSSPMSSPLPFSAMTVRQWPNISPFASHGRMPKIVETPQVVVRGGPVAGQPRHPNPHQQQPIITRANDHGHTNPSTSFKPIQERQVLETNHRPVTQPVNQQQQQQTRPQTLPNPAPAAFTAPPPPPPFVRKVDLLATQMDSLTKSFAENLKEQKQFQQLILNELRSKQQTPTKATTPPGFALKESAAPKPSSESSSPQSSSLKPSNDMQPEDKAQLMLEDIVKTMIEGAERLEQNEEAERLRICARVIQKKLQDTARRTSATAGSSLIPAYMLEELRKGQISEISKHKAEAAACEEEHRRAKQDFMIEKKQQACVVADILQAVSNLAKPQLNGFGFQNLPGAVETVFEMPQVQRELEREFATTDHSYVRDPKAYIMNQCLFAVLKDILHKPQQDLITAGANIGEASIKNWAKPANKNKNKNKARPLEHKSSSSGNNNNNNNNNTPQAGSRMAARAREREAAAMAARERATAATSQEEEKKSSSSHVAAADAKPEEKKKEPDLNEKKDVDKKNTIVKPTEEDDPSMFEQFSESEMVGPPTESLVPAGLTDTFATFGAMAKHFKQKEKQEKIHEKENALRRQETEARLEDERKALEAQFPIS